MGRSVAVGPAGPGPLATLAPPRCGPGEAELDDRPVGADIERIRPAVVAGELARAVGG